ncbi:sugar transferase [Aeromicrobium sp.]|uniref:sugar transferase n=1 Tax=Aeromicrobium sp. TaxID=1871063 RepID=UPI00198C21AB|nr:sugar transferase [Aeromicrobium sp.]MBC7632007.1 sugar transferase [Aeromicrobium sp.]
MSGQTYDPLKRALDVVGATSLFVVTLPVQAVVAALIRLRLGAPILFRQDRPGRNNEIFTLVKFRTMADSGATDAERMTPLGQRLRSLSLDELPTLINVVRGHMSLVGPRPLLVAYLERYSPDQARRHEVRPGITGLAQVSGRNGLPWEDRLALDVAYVDSRSLRTDLAILAKTILPVLGRRGITEEGAATMTEFQGSQ